MADSREPAAAEAGAKAEGDSGEVFRRSTMSRIASADDLDHYIKLTNPSAWVVILAALLLVGGILIWAVVAVVPVTKNVTGILLRNTNEAARSVVVCVVDEDTAQKLSKPGATMAVDGIEAESFMVNSLPASALEIRDLFDSEYFADSLNLSDWNYVVSMGLAQEPKHTDYTVGTDMGEAFLVPVTIVVSETHPINIVLGKT